MADIFSSLRELLQEWQLRALVLLSLTLQIVLIILGNRRKYTDNFWIKTIVWLAYLTADSVATAALGILARNMFGVAGFLNAEMELTAFWAPFLLLHLGGPDTITAYSLEDNELWSRHLLQLVVQTGFAFYVFLMAWTGSRLSILSIPMMFVGLIKYGERTWVLWSTSEEQRRLSISKHVILPNHDQQFLSPVTEGKLLEIAYGLLEITKRFFADIPLAKNVLRESSKVFEDISDHANAFKVIEMDLGFMYDMLYTKAMVIYTPWGIGLRFISFLLTGIVLVSFTTVAHDKYSKLKVDLCITLLLVSMAILLELYAALVLLCADQSLVWLRKHNMITNGMGLQVLLGNPRWSNTMGQYSLLSYFLKEKPMGYRRLLLGHLPKSCQKIPNVSKMLEKLENKEYEDNQKVPEDLKEFTFTFFQKELRDFYLTSFGQSFNHLRCESMGRMSLTHHDFHTTIYDSYSVKHGYRTLSEMEFEQSIIIWHIATELCYHLDIYNAKAPQSIKEIAEMSNYISRYMMYLLVMSPDMLPGGGVLVETNLPRTCIEARSLLEEFLINLEKVNGEGKRETKIQMLYDRFKSQEPEAVLNENLLFHACKVVNGLCGVDASSEEEGKVMRRWSAIRGVWMELLGYTSIQLRRSQHGQQLRKGGEFLTHVALVMTLVDYANFHSAPVSAFSDDVLGVTVDDRSPATEVVLGQKKWVINPREFSITWGNNSDYWRIHKESDTDGAAEVAELVDVCHFEVTGSTKENLTPGKKYEFYLTISMKQGAYGWNGVPVFVMAKIGQEGRYTWTKIYLSDHFGENNVIIPRNKLQIEVPAARNDNSDPDTRLYFRLYEVWDGNWKRGLIIHNAQVQEAQR